MKTFFIIILILLGLRLLVRIFLPFILTFVAKKAQQNMQEHFRRNGYPGGVEDVKPEGTIEVNFVPHKKNPTDKSSGDFVDYEEVK